MSYGETIWTDDPQFPRNAQQAVENAQLRHNIRKATTTIRERRAGLVVEMPDWQALRAAGEAIKDDVLMHLDRYLEQFEQAASARGAQVHWARDADEANRILISLVRQTGEREVIKSKSMATEEIGLDDALARSGITAIETDLAELIIQLGHDRPSHIVVPAIHKNRAEIREIFEREMDDAPADLSDDPHALADAARRHLRRKFLSAKVAVSGANFAIADTGSLVVAESEGNARMCLTLPETLISVVGIEKLVPTFRDLEVFLQLLPRSSTGERMNPYNSVWTGVTPGDGPQQVHIVLLDNGRTNVLRDQSSEEARALFAGVAAHAFRPFGSPMSSAIGVALGTAAHRYGWPVAEGGSASITRAMVSMLTEKHARFETGVRVQSLHELGTPDIVMLDLAPAAAARLAGERMPRRIARALTRYRHGPATFKVDFAVEGGIPWTYESARRAGTVHLGGGLNEIAAGEKLLHTGRTSESPFVLVCQQYLADPARSRGDVHPIYSYAHVPAGYTAGATEQIEAQIERFAPGFRERILARHARTVAQTEGHNPNYVRGDVVTGSNDPLQLIFRPRLALDPYSTGIPGVYICSAATPPGAGAHGMCGYNAALSALRHLKPHRDPTHARDTAASDTTSAPVPLSRR